MYSDSDIQNDEENEGKTFWEDDKGEITLIALFSAEITEEHIYVDGKKIQRYYLITGQVGKQLQEPVIVHSTEFPGMNWVTEAWGSQAIVLPKPGAKEQVRTAIQMQSTPTTKIIHTHLGWTVISKLDVYLSTNSAITNKGRIDTVNVQVPADLGRFKFLPSTEKEIKDGINKSLELINLGTEEVMWLMLACVYRAPIGESDFAAHITGRTGTYKSELAAIMQSHWGVCTSRELPASWGSTANALEALCYKAKDCLIVCDDFIPSGTSWQVKAYQKTADQLIRAQGNLAGRARLTDKSMLQETMYPRGLILSTGEDTPEGHSVRARMMIGELSPGDVDTELLTIAQSRKQQYNNAMNGYIKWLSLELSQKKKHAKKIANETRDQNITIGHSRTPSILGELMSGVSTFLMFANDVKAITPNFAAELYRRALKSLQSLAQRQIEYLIAADPADQFIEILRGIFAANAGHLKGMHGGVPKDAPILGWSTIGDLEDMEYKAHGPRLGWVDDRNEIIYLDATVAYDTIRRHSRGAITITRATLYKRLREAGHLAKTDQGRQRNTVRVQLENASRQVLALHKKSITQGIDNEKKES